VLAANRHDYAASGEGFDVSLERHEGFADGIALADVDSAESIIADHPTPERVVEVEHQALAASPDTRGDQRGDTVCIGRKVFGCAGEFREVEIPLVAPVPPSDRGRNRVEIVDLHPSRRLTNEFSIHPI